MKCNMSTKAYPFSVPARVMEAVRLVEVPKEEAEFFVIPFFQACTDWNFSKMKVYLHNAKMYVGRQRTPRFLWIAAHDWSRCFAWEWDPAKLRKQKLDRSLPEVRGDHLFTTNGDSNMNCYDPSLDVVIPPE